MFLNFCFFLSDVYSEKCVNESRQTTHFAGDFYNISNIFQVLCIVRENL